MGNTSLGKKPAISRQAPGVPRATPGKKQAVARSSKLRVPHLVIAGGGLLVVMVGAVLLGTIDLGWQRVFAEVWAQLTGGVSPLTRQESAILWQIRVPRVVLASLVGAALASSGAAYQGVFRNPLADPYLLGVAAGAGMAATLVIAFAPDSTGWLLAPAAFAGSLVAVAVTWLLGRSAGGRSGTATLLLAGIAVAAFLTAVQNFALQYGGRTIRQIYAWLLGSMVNSGWSQVLHVLPYVLASSIVLLACGRLLDVLALGDEEARSLGVRAGRVRIVVLGVASLATAAAVSATGLIGFVGIVVPHAVRLLAGVSYRILVPLSLLGGAAFLVLADMVARTVIAPAELPIGVVTAFTGAPFFVVILRRSRRVTQ